MPRAWPTPICYEGYVLYPYRASAQKNQLRWQFGVLAPPSVAAGGSEPSTAQTELIVETRPGARLHVRLRALQVQQRTVEARTGGGFVAVADLDDGEQVWTSFDEAVDHETDLVDIDLEAAAALRVPPRSWTCPGAATTSPSPLPMAPPGAGWCAAAGRLPPLSACAPLPWAGPIRSPGSR